MKDECNWVDKWKHSHRWSSFCQDMKTKARESTTSLVVVPTAAECIKRSKNPTGYFIFLDRFIRRVVGCNKFNREAAVMLLDDFVMLTDEAFAMLVYENQEERWTRMFDEKLKRLPMAAKFTDGGGGKNREKLGRNRKNQGWSPEGIERFNQLCEIVFNDRQTQSGHNMMRDYRKRRVEMLGAKGGQEKRAPFVQEKRRKVKAFNEMDKDVCMSGRGDADLQQDSSVASVAAGSGSTGHCNEPSTEIHQV